MSIHPNLLIFVEGVSYAGDLSGVATLPVQLNVPNQLVYEAHDYGFWYSKGFTSYSNYVNTITPKWGYLITGGDPQPLWIGEFGTCNSNNTCVMSDNATDLGYWFQSMTSFVEQYGIDWSYWAINGTTETGNSGGSGTVEGYGVLNTSWNGSALPALTSRLQSMMAESSTINLVANPGAVTLVPGAAGNATVAIVPAAGFTGTVNLSCSVSGPTGAVDPPQCSVPSSITTSNNAVASATISITTTGTIGKNAPARIVPPRFPSRAAGFALVCGLLLFGNLSPVRRRILLLLVLLTSSFAVTACGSGSVGGSGASTSTGSYLVTVAASASGMNPVSTQIGLTIQ